MTAAQILITGASGSIGHLVALQLAAAQIPLRVACRRPHQLDGLGFSDEVAVDYDSPSSLAAAASGVESVFIYTPETLSDDLPAALLDAGVERVVLLSSGSVLLPGAEEIPSARHHREAEELFGSVSYHLLPIRPLRLASDALRWSAEIKARQPVPIYRPDARTAPVHEQDVAAMAVHALLTGDSSASEPLTGPALITQAEQLDLISANTGIPISINELNASEAVQFFAARASRIAAEATVSFLDNAVAGRSPIFNTIPAVLGRPAAGFELWAKDHASDFR